VILATGAWRDRPLPVEGIERFVDRGFVYQNPFVYRFNHFEEPGYDGPPLEVADGAIVVGGGLASVDVVKIINIELYRRALRARGVEVDALELEHAGVPATLSAHGLSAEELGVRGCTLYYRRGMEDMPVASAPNPTPALLEKLRSTRVRIMEKVIRKYGVCFEPRCVPVAPIEDGDRLGGLVFRRTEVVDGRVREVPGSDFEVRAPLTVSSIGSLPRLIEGVPARGDLYAFASEATGEVGGLDQVFGLGNVLTGKGNIRDSRTNAGVVAEHIIENLLGVADDPSAEVLTESLHGEFRARAKELLARALGADPLPPDAVATILEWVRSRWAEVGYDGDYRAWAEAHRPPGT